MPEEDTDKMHQAERAWWLFPLMTSINMKIVAEEEDGRMIDRMDCNMEGIALEVFVRYYDKVAKDEVRLCLSAYLTRSSRLPD